MTVVITAKNKNKKFDESPLLKLGKMCQRWGNVTSKVWVLQVNQGFEGQIKVR